MTLAAGRELDRAFGKIGVRDLAKLVRDDLVVDAGPAPPDEPASIRTGTGKPGRKQCLEERQSVIEFVRGDRRGRQALRHLALLEGAVRSISGIGRFCRSVTKDRRFVGQNLLGLVDLRTLKGFEALDFVDGKIGEEAKETADITVFGIAPELPEKPRASTWYRRARPHLVPSCPSWLQTPS